VFLMDEPLSNLDAKLRVQTRTQIAALQRRLGITTVYVTHDQVEAMTMGDRVAVLKDGVLQQCASPRDLFTRPANVFVAGFIGSPAMNVLQCTVTDAGGEFASLHIPLTGPQRSALTSDQITVGVRPEGLHVSEDGTGLHARIDTVEELGSDSYLYCTPDGHAETTVVSRAEGLSTARAGDHVVLRPDIGAVHLFDTVTGARLPD
jgi:multiple sugar transport system ATP-binding protein